jgi:thiamine pyrophosphate-dependent acetolactate synthase large subunit-like protein
MGGYGAYMPAAVDKYQASSLSGDYTGMVKAMGGYAERIEEASSIRDALIRGIKETQAGNPAMLEVMTREEPVLAMAKQWGM